MVTQKLLSSILKRLEEDNLTRIRTTKILERKLMPTLKQKVKARYGSNKPTKNPGKGKKK